ncbi:MAG: hypothetical protein IPP52_19165 [Ignavibacteria bacterium]|nr:hypothetical protein [Ignavibacteria bacterium]
MKKTGKLFFTLLFVVFAMNFATAQNPTFTLTASNFEFTDSIGTGGFSDDAMTFDIMILHTNLVFQDHLNSHWVSIILM